MAGRHRLPSPIVALLRNGLGRLAGQLAELLVRANAGLPPLVPAPHNSRQPGASPPSHQPRAAPPPPPRSLQSRSKAWLVRMVRHPMPHRTDFAGRHEGQPLHRVGAAPEARSSPTIRPPAQPPPISVRIAGPPPAPVESRGPSVATSKLPAQPGRPALPGDKGFAARRPAPAGTASASRRAFARVNFSSPCDTRFRTPKSLRYSYIFFLDLKLCSRVSRRPPSATAPPSPAPAGSSAPRRHRPATAPACRARRRRPPRGGPPPPRAPPGPAADCRRTR